MAKTIELILKDDADLAEISVLLFELWDDPNVTRFIVKNDTEEQRDDEHEGEAQ